MRERPRGMASLPPGGSGARVTPLPVRPDAGEEGRPDYRLFDNLIFRVNKLASSYFKSASRYYQRHFGMGIPEVRLVNTIGRYGPLGSSEAAELSLMDKAMVSRALAALTRRGFVRTAADPGDSRKIVLALTEAGRATHRELLAAKRERHRRTIACLSPEECRLAYDLLDRLYEAAEALRLEELRAGGAEERG